jgi:putative transposase
VRFIDQHAGRRTLDGLRWGVEPICRVLTDQGTPIAPSTYYDARARASRPSRRAARDQELKTEITALHAANYGVYGARKVWLALNRRGTAVARCTVERLMGELGLRGAIRGKVKRTTIGDLTAKRPADLVGRKFAPTAPDRLWVADMTYVSTWSGWVYVAFVTDWGHLPFAGDYARRVLGWSVATSMSTQLVLNAIEQAIWSRGRAGRDDLTGLVHHTDRGVLGSASVNASLTPASAPRSGPSADNALAETINGLHKTELIRPRGPWRTVEQVEVATAEWVDWFNHRRLYEYDGDIPPAELEDAYHAQH